MRNYFSSRKRTSTWFHRYVLLVVSAIHVLAVYTQKAEWGPPAFVDPSRELLFFVNSNSTLLTERAYYALEYRQYSIDDRSHSFNQTLMAAIEALSYPTAIIPRDFTLIHQFFSNDTMGGCQPGYQLYRSQQFANDSQLEAQLISLLEPYAETQLAICREMSHLSNTIITVFIVGFVATILCCCWLHNRKQPNEQYESDDETPTRLRELTPTEVALMTELPINYGSMQ